VSSGEKGTALPEGRSDVKLPPGPRVTRGFHEVVLSVYDFDRIARPLEGVGAFKLQSLPDAPPGQFKAWRVPAGCTRIEQAYLAPIGTNHGRGGLRLVKFHGVPQRVMRSSQRSWDTGGIFDIDVFSRDCDAVYAKLQTYGWTALGDPVRYQEAQFDVKQVVAIGPDGLMVAIIQRFKPPVDDLEKFDAMSNIFNSTQMVADYDRSAKFYRDVLGWPATLEFTIDSQAEPGVDVLGLPMPQAEKAERKIGMFKPADSPDGAIELIENSTMRGKDFSAHCVAPNIGILSLLIPVPDAAALAAAVVARGGHLYSNLSTFELHPHGAVSSFSTRSPEGAILEFYQRLH